MCTDPSAPVSSCLDVCIQLTDCLKKAIDQYLMARDDDQFHPMAGTALPPAGRSARMGVHAPSEDIMLPLKWDYSPEDFLDGCDHAAGVGPLVS